MSALEDSSEIIKGTKMDLEVKHPLYTEMLEDWYLMRDTYSGQKRVKEQGELYLKPTSGMYEDGMMTTNSEGYRAYTAYKHRAVFHNFVKKAVSTMIGMMHQKPPIFVLPKELAYLEENATASGEGLSLFLRRINEQQLVTGRVGILLDIDPATKKPYFSIYKAEDIINWQEDRFVILDETDYYNDPDSETFDWDLRKKFRLIKKDASGNFVVEVHVENLEPEIVTPALKGTKLTEMPFSIINSSDHLWEPDSPPLVDLARLCIAIYNGEADYRQNLFMQGQDTLAIIGYNTDTDTKVRVGAGAVIRVPLGGDIKYVGVNSAGLPEQRLSISNDKSMAIAHAAQLIDSGGSEKESGEALRVRVAAQTASLTQVVLAGAIGLQNVIKIAAKLLGANPEEVLIKPNRDFTDNIMDGQNLMNLMNAKTMGVPLSTESLHALMRKNGLTERTFEEEVALLNTEEISWIQPVMEQQPLNQPNQNLNKQETKDSSQK